MFNLTKYENYIYLYKSSCGSTKNIKQNKIEIKIRFTRRGSRI